MSNSKRSQGRGGSGGASGLGDPRVFGFRPHRNIYLQIVVAIWRWALELVLLVLLLWCMHQAGELGVTHRVFLLGVLVLLLVWMLHPVTRRAVTSVFWVFVTRHRLRTFFVESRVYNRSGKLPWVLTVRPTAVGERCWLWLMPGLSIEDFENAIERIATASWARHARVERHRSNGSLVRVDVIRRDPLTSTSFLPSVLIPKVKAESAEAKKAADLTSYPGSDKPAGLLHLPRRVIDLTTSTTSKSATPSQPPAPRRAPSRPSQPGTAPSNGASDSPRSRGAGGEDVSDYL